MFSFFVFVCLFVWAGARRGLMGWICRGSVRDIHKLFCKLIMCQNVFCKSSTHAMYLKKKKKGTYFHMWLCILPLEGQTWSPCFVFVFFISGSVHTVLLHSETVSWFWRNLFLVKVVFLFEILCSLSLTWSSTAPCCLKIILPRIRDSSTMWGRWSCSFVTRVLPHAFFWNHNE